MSAKERTGFRCEWISERHRLWDKDCPAIDLDFVLVEYTYSTPVAIIEYKHIRAPEPVLTDPSYKALRALADRYQPFPLPFLIVVYQPEPTQFRIIPANKCAEEYLGSDADKWMNETDYVKGLMILRRSRVTANDELTLRKLEAA